MPRNRPPTSGYARIAQAEEEEEEEQEQEDTAPYSDNDDPFADHRQATLSTPGSQYEPIQPKRREGGMHQYSASVGSPSSHRRPRRRRTNSGVDIKAINMRLERWAEEIKDRFKIRRVKGKSAEDEHLEIYSSVFQAPEGIRPATKKSLEEMDEGREGLSKLEFDDLVESVRTAIELGMHPSLIAQGSSGSYFARNSGGKVVGVFKPKDEEPYASKNPKWTKWIHRNLLPFAFGRAMLIPNLSYVSEAAAYVLDCQLRTHIVPYTDVVGLSSKSFHYDFWERRSYWKKGKPLPEKLGSFQVFLKGFKGATEFFKDHPWPDTYSRAGVANTGAARRKKRRRWAENCRPGSATAAEDEESEDEREDFLGAGGSRDASRRREEFWSEELQLSFREELEKLVILDYVMRNTDRGTDNWMIRIDRVAQRAELVVEPPSTKQQQQNGHTDGGGLAEEEEGYKRPKENMTASYVRPAGSERLVPRIGAIDNSLSWPWKHPDAWRSYPFGWLFLPVSLIGRPFSQKTREHFLPLLTSKDWWSDTQVKLRRCFELDSDFQERMFARQIAVMKGQAWNVVETLKSEDHGPLELTRRGRVMVWDDVVEVPVAVRMVRPSEEMRRSVTAENVRLARKVVGGEGLEGMEEEEMDISAAHPASAPQHDLLLGLGSPTKSTNEQARNPFNHSRQNSSQDVRADAAQRTLSPPSTRHVNKEALATPSSGSTRPGQLRSITGQGHGRMSHEIPRLAWQSPSERRRRFSFAHGKRSEEGEEEDGDGDLGFAAMREQESSRRKVIVERLEMVRSKGPVFTWC